jgi:hypothetical protein
MSMDSRLKRLEGSVGTSGEFTEDVKRGDKFCFYGFLGSDGSQEPGTHYRTHQEAPVAFQRAATWMGLVVAVTVLFSDHFGDNKQYRDKARAILDLNGDESEPVALSRCLDIARQSGMNKRELGKVEASIVGALKKARRLVKTGPVDPELRPADPDPALESEPVRR